LRFFPPPSAAHAHAHTNWDRSLLTFIVYLTDDFEGGGTLFYPKLFEVRPIKGMACLFFHGEHELSPGMTRHDTTRTTTHDIPFGPHCVSCRAVLRVVPTEHEGMVVTKGRKYVLRSDVMYRALNKEKL
jgi:hypothetical protein